jgi:hypothetical protein
MTALLQNSNESQTFAKCLQMAARANDGEVYHLPTTTHKLQLATIAAFKINNIDYIIYGSNASRSPENWEGDVDLYTFKATDACHVICDTVTKMGGVVIQVVRAINVSTYRVKVFGKHFIDVSYIPEGLFTEYKKYTNEHHGANELMHYLAVARVPLFPRRCIPSTNTEQDASPKYQKALKLLHEEIPHLPPSLQHVGLSNYTMHEIRPHSDWIPGGIVALACIARACEHLPPWLAFKGRRLELPVGSPITYFRRVESHPTHRYLNLLPNPTWNAQEKCLEYEDRVPFDMVMAEMWHPDVPIIAGPALEFILQEFWAILTHPILTTYFPHSLLGDCIHLAIQLRRHVKTIYPRQASIQRSSDPFRLKLVATRNGVSTSGVHEYIAKFLSSQETLPLFTVPVLNTADLNRYIFTIKGVEL